MRLALLTDSHFGWKSDSLLFQDYFIRFYDNVFFPYLKAHNITDVVHLGDIFNKRKYINFHILYRTRNEFLEKLSNYKTHIILGNHDIYFRDLNDINSVRELCGHYPNFHVYEEPQEVTIGGLRMLFVPWLNPNNTSSGLDLIKTSKTTVLMGHLEIAGFHYDRSTICEHGLDKNIFKKFKHVFSGHFHTKSQAGNIQYLGSPYQMTFADCGDERGFHIFDTETLELEFVKNPYPMFFRITYDDRDINRHAEMLAEDFSKYQGCQVKVLVNHKTDPYLYDRWMTKLEAANPDTIQPIETFCLDVDESADEQFGDFGNGGEVILSSTLQILENYVDAIGMEIDKSKLKIIIRQLYTEAVQIGG